MLFLATQTLQAGPYDQDFLQAIRNKDTHKMRSLLELGAQRYFIGTKGETPLTIAIQSVLDNHGHCDSKRAINCLQALIVFGGVNEHEIKQIKKTIPHYITSIIETALLDRQRLLIMYLQLVGLVDSKITPRKLYSFVANELKK